MRKCLHETERADDRPGDARREDAADSREQMHLVFIGRRVSGMLVFHSLRGISGEVRRFLELVGKPAFDDLRQPLRGGAEGGDEAEERGQPGRIAAGRGGGVGCGGLLILVLLLVGGVRLLDCAGGSGGLVRCLCVSGGAHAEHQKGESECQQVRGAVGERVHGSAGGLC